MRLQIKVRCTFASSLEIAVMVVVVLVVPVLLAVLVVLVVPLAAFWTFRIDSRPSI